MEMTFRWFGSDDAVPLAYIRQIPAVRGIVSALYDVPVGEPWSLAKLTALKNRVEEAGLRLAVIESIPVHEDIKLGRPTRDRLIETYQVSIRNMGRLGIPVLCYNFMPVCDWTRTELFRTGADGSTSLAYAQEHIDQMDFEQAGRSLPGWATRYTREELAELLAAYRDFDAEALWGSLKYFLRAVVPVAAEAGVKLAVHPDDPPWPVLDLPRIVSTQGDLERLVKIVDHECNGVTFCVGSLGPNAATDLAGALTRLLAWGRVHFVHLRNIKRDGRASFHETAHPTFCGDIDMYAVMKALVLAGYQGVARPDHGRMIWGEEGKPGYGLYDRALGAMYLWGLYEGVAKSLRSPFAASSETGPWRW